MDFLQEYIILHINEEEQDEEDRNRLTIGKKDSLLKMLQDKVRELENVKKEKRRNVREKMKMNRVLENVLKDYEHKENMIIEMKEKQKKQIYEIIEYLEKSMKSIGVSTSKLQQVTYERKRLLKQIDDIQNDIDDMLTT